MLQGWSATLVSLGMEREFLERHETFTPRAAFNFIALDARNPGSILACLRAARENARAVRGAINADLWETLNFTYLESRAFSPGRPDAGGSRHCARPAACPGHCWSPGAGSARCS